MVNHRRTRDGCWTCRRRKKKCDSLETPCNNCSRLKLQCQRDVRVVWEDDAKRHGMRNRGPRPVRHDSVVAETHESIISLRDGYAGNIPVLGEEHGVDCTRLALTPMDRPLTLWPTDLNHTEFMLLEHYVNRFSRTYPTFSGPNNPFLKVFLPLAMRNRAVLDALLALSGVQSWSDSSYDSDSALLNLRQKALRGCRTLLGSVDHSSFSSSALLRSGVDLPSREDLIFVLASCGMLLLYEKLSDEHEDSCTPHLRFFARLIAGQILPTMASHNSKHGGGLLGEAFRFLTNLFLYNDLVRATSLRKTILSSTYIESLMGGERSIDTYVHCGADKPLWEVGDKRFGLPYLIARLSIGDSEVTDAAIQAWDGRLDWLPSFALVSEAGLSAARIVDYSFIEDAQYRRINDFCDLSSCDDRAMVTELYRIAAMIYRRQCLFADSRYSRTANLPSWGAQLVYLLPQGSMYLNMLLWPVGIIAKELGKQHQEERFQILQKLQYLEKEFKMQHFGRVRAHLMNYWHNRDEGYENHRSVILFG